MISKGLSAAVLGLALIAAPAYGHHPEELFDKTQVINIEGTVSEFGWSFPHGSLVVDVAEEDGRQTTWELQMGAPTQLRRHGWQQRALDPGDEVVVTIYPMKDGSSNGAVLAVEFNNGVLMVDEEYWNFVDDYRFRP